MDLAEINDDLLRINPKDRKRQSLYFSRSAYENFAKELGIISASRMIEWFMIKYVESVKTKGKRKKS